MNFNEVANSLLEQLIATKGLSFRKGKEDKAFWYTTNKPGPFYINTENIVGKQNAELLLEKITMILGENTSRTQQMKKVMSLINQVLESDHAYNHSINKLIEYYRSNSTYNPAVVSGGERRDWFFSIPIAQKLNLPHVYLFKSGEHLVTNQVGDLLDWNIEKQKVLHIADIINQASSYSSKWTPILRNLGADFKETLSVAVRNQKGVEVLNQSNINVISPLRVDRELFMEASNIGLINDFALNEINLFYESPIQWTRHYLNDFISGAHQTKLTSLEKKRVDSFKKMDPYNLKEEFPDFFG
ncbi:hypothetical protein PA598K_04006 [Paenibacillus sp. 598K]|uniref:hypothetical protein n=1 Tax=Paenibacillus sp. 598K TaxID=1117987 RepID=UPI000FFA0726|nr:hypothetical protein [Paenibacillus sp. 598K]GBF75588.1 hypothetical protein PA598K_04006 [Paenibacillus sp. 598K]